MDEYHSVASWDFFLGMQAARDAGFSSVEMESLQERWECACKDELQRRLRHVPLSLRSRILWEGRIRHIVFPALPDIRPMVGYFLLPLQADGSDDTPTVLAMPPHPMVAAEIFWPWSASLYSWLAAPGTGRGVEWLLMMLEECGLPPEAQRAWSPPIQGYRGYDPRRWMRFNRELKIALTEEAKSRLETVADWLLLHSLQDKVFARSFLTIHPAENDYDPERSDFIFRIKQSSGDACLVVCHTRRKPVLIPEPYAVAKDFVSKSSLAEMHAWLLRLSFEE